MDARAKWIKGLAIVTLILAIALLIVPIDLLTNPDAIKADPKSTGDSGPAEFAVMIIVIGFFLLLEVPVAIGNWFLVRAALNLTWRPVWLLQVVLPILIGLVLFLIPGGVLAIVLFNLVAPIAVLILRVKPKRIIVGEAA